jgi:chromosome segregation ATPase
MSKDSEESSRIEELEGELSLKEREIKELQKKIADLQGRFQEMVEDKKILRKSLNQLELKEVELKLNKYHEIQEDYHKIKHRSQVTKSQLDDARKELNKREIVIKDLEKRGFLDYLLRRFPETFHEYKK